MTLSSCISLWYEPTFGAKGMALSNARRASFLRLGEWPVQERQQFGPTPNGAADCSLAEAFWLALRSADAVRAVSSDASVSSALQALVSRCRSRWPQIQVSASAFARFVAERISLVDRGSVEDALKDVVAEDLWLTHACLQGDACAHKELKRLLCSVADTSGANKGLSVDGAQDLLQTVLELLLVGRDGSPGKLAGYSGRGVLSSWLWTVVFREALKLKQQRVYDEPFEDGLVRALWSSDNNPELRKLRAECLIAFRRSFRAAVSRLSSQERLLLRSWLYDGLSLEEAAATLGIHRTTAVRWVKEIKASLQKNTLLELGKDLSLKRSEVESVMRELDSCLEASLSDAIGGYEPSSGGVQS
jgi:RNA polymerase sigma-70 factor (ECF subfamily)